MEEEITFRKFLEDRQKSDEIKFFEIPVIKKAYFIGAYSRAVIASSYFSKVSKKNVTFKNWLSNQIINYRNLDRIFEIAYRYEQKLKLEIKNDSEVRKLVHEVPTSKRSGISSAKISYAFVAGFDDYKKYTEENKSNSNGDKNGGEDDISKAE